MILNPEQKLRIKIKRENLIPDPENIGEFIKGDRKKRFGFLSANNWVFHKDIAKLVLQGKYDEITPFSTEFVTTNNCSNRCDICGYGPVKMLENVWTQNLFDDEENHMKDFDYAKSLLDKLIDGGIKGVTFTGGGEPFLFIGLENLVQHVTDRGIDSVAYTNGNSISRNRISKLIKAQPKIIRVSLNAGTKMVYDEFHKPLKKNGAFQRTLKTIEQLAIESQDYPDLTIGIGVVINEINQDDLVNTALRIKEITDKTGGGIDFIAYRPAFDYYRKIQLSPELLDRTHNTIERFVRNVLKNTGVSVSNVTCRYDALKKDTRTYKQCRSTGLFAELGPSGHLHHCCDRNLNRKYRIGDLKTQSVQEIYESDRRKQVLQYISQNNCKICPPACKTHEMNIKFQQIEDLRDAKKLYKVELWIDEQRKMPKPKMVNF
ncbi:radical SAM protein [Candidatus Pacearchaeota archaeon]|nr:radical SAM protein [Candidatus Pacearchaeota archaeon]